jgi:predicted SPOUT superfamily RNA methylase MTH1
VYIFFAILLLSAVTVLAYKAYSFYKKEREEERENQKRLEYEFAMANSILKKADDLYKEGLALKDSAQKLLSSAQTNVEINAAITAYEEGLAKIVLSIENARAAKLAFDDIRNSLSKQKW